MKSNKKRFVIAYFTAQNWFEYYIEHSGGQALTSDSIERATYFDTRKEADDVQTRLLASTPDKWTVLEVTNELKTLNAHGLPTE